MGAAGLGLAELLSAPVVGSLFSVIGPRLCRASRLPDRIPGSIEPGTHVLRLLNQVRGCEVATSGSTSVATVLTSAVLVPSAPLLVPELSGDSAESAQVRAAATTAVSRLAHEAVHWVGVGVGPENAEPEKAAGELWRSGVGRGQIGTFAGFGADVRTSLDADAAGEPMPSLELCALVAGWLRGRTDVEITVDMHVVSAKASANECREFGQQLRKQLDSDNRPQGLLIVADGASTLTAKAPGSFDERAAGVQSAIDDALTAGDPEALLALDPRLCRSVGAQGRAAWQVLAGVFTGSSRSAHPRATVDYSDAPFGVGYHVGTWRP